MERIICLPKNNNIISTKELDLLNINGEYDGIILVKEGEKIIGSVHSLEDEKWHLETFETRAEFNSLAIIIEKYPKHTFIYLEEV